MCDKINHMVNFTCKEQHKNLRLMFEDEAGFGRTNKPHYCWCGRKVRPVVPCHRIRDYIYAYGAVSPIDGEMVSLVLPRANTKCMNIFLKEVSNRYPNDYILMVADNASWHKSKELVIPENIEIFPLLPYTPELNHIEQIWEEIREKNFKNELFKTLASVVDRLCVGLLTLEFDKNKVKSITGRDWLLQAF
jgi:transposase